MPGDDTTLSTRTWGRERPVGPGADLPTHAGRDRYLLLGALGRGGMGEVLRVRDQRLDTELAMKVLSAELTHSDRAQARFRHEVAITAQLRHPGIVSVHDRGELDDGRPWFTMTEVRGRTLAEVLAEHHSSPRPGSLRTLVDLVRRTAEAVAYAHSEGVVHRDLKPSNVMVGEFGELCVMDWGLARRLDSDEEDGPLPELSTAASATRTGDIIGTPGFMAPEQARGEGSRLGPPSDVYSLGSVLYNALSGQRPFRGSAYEVMAALLAGPPPSLRGTRALDQTLPEELVEACERAMARDPDERFPDASGLVRALTDWLDGARRTEEAQRAVDRARRIRPEIEDLRERAQGLQDAANDLLANIRPNDPVAKKRSAWALLDQADSLLNAAAIQEATWLQTVRSALNQVPDFPPADALLAGHYRDLLLEAERTGAKVDAARAEALLRAHDHGEHGALLEGRAWLTLHTEPRGARATLYTWVERDRRLELQFARDLGPTPLRKAAIPHGSHVVRIEHNRCEPVEYPVHVGRLEHWDGIPPGQSEPATIPLPPTGSLGPDEIYVPAGWAVGGGDPDGLDSIPHTRCWVPAFSMHREPVIWRDYLDFLDHLHATDGLEAARAHAPRGMKGADEHSAVRHTPNGFEVGLSADGEAYRADCAVELVTWRDALAYCAWMLQKTGRRWSLPNGLAWEKAARGVDGRPYPWGHHFDATYANLVSHFDPPRLVPTAEVPSDRSPYGVLGMAGGVREWCIHPWRHEGPKIVEQVLQPDDIATDADPDYREIRGGNWQSVAGSARSAARFAGFPDQRVSGLGFRLCRWLETDDSGRILW